MSAILTNAPDESSGKAATIVRDGDYIVVDGRICILPRSDGSVEVLVLAGSNRRLTVQPVFNDMVVIRAEWS